jgi:phosphoribosylamine--glycine ligase/phosphoribosylformylglycinamidine cyclo-ligase
MGTYAPAPDKIVTKEMLKEINRTILEPSIQGMKQEGFPFVGCLFTGLMITKDGPKVLEYNVRFGDPETQSLLPLLETDLAEIMLACTSGRLADLDFKISPKSAATIVLAAGGYPGSYKKGISMELGETPEDVVIFHAGTDITAGGNLVTSGGRVIASTAVADTLEAAIKKAYEGVECIAFKGRQFRTDIGARALK